MERFWKYRLDHLLFWIITIGFHIYTRLDLLHTAGPFQFVLEIVVRNVLLAAIIYTNLSFLIPYFAKRGQSVLYVAGLAASFGFYVLGKNIHDVHLAKNVSGVVQSFWKYSFYNFSISLFYMAFALALELSRQWYFQRERLRRAEVENLNTELAYLKSQINPHFLFNSINTIYFQIDKQNSIARDALNTFSDMLRYQLYECSEKEIGIEKELSYLKNYVALQRMRRDDSCVIRFDYGPEVSNFTIAPLLMITFVENAFKHVSDFSDRPNDISVSLALSENRFMMNVENSKNQRSDTSRSGGIGLKNVKRRLDLLYAGRHTLEINETEDRFSVRMEIIVG